MRKKILFMVTTATLLSVRCPDFANIGIGLQEARAQDDDPEVTKMAKQHFKLGLDAYNAGKYDVAIKELKKAYLLKRLPPILLNIGLTYRKTKDFDMATYFYKKFLNEAPADDKQRPSAESALKEIEDEKAQALQAQQQPASKPAVEAVPSKPRPAAGASVEPGRASPAVQAGSGGGAGSGPVTEWSHTPLDAVPPGHAIDVRVQMPVMKGVKVKVYYRREGQAGFESMELKRRGNEKVARLPATLAEGKTFQYYVEARDPAGTLVKGSGSEASPNIVLIDASARPQVAGAEVPEGEDEESKRPKKGFSRDIENEAATFDVNRDAMSRLREQMRRGEAGKERKPSALGGLGWGGVGLMAGGVAVGVLGGVFYGLAKGRADAVSADSTCNGPDHQIKVGGVSQCPHYGANPDPSMNRALPAPTSADYDAEGRTFHDVSMIGYAAPALVAGGLAMLIVDVVKHRAAEEAKHPKAKPGGKKRKVKKVIEVEEDAGEPAALRLDVRPVLGLREVGVVGELRF